MTVKPMCTLAAIILLAPVAWADSNNATGNDDIYKVGGVEVMRLTTSHILSASTISATTYVNAIPSGLIAAFASTSCPAGWSEYTAARGRFLRGIDNGAGNDPDGTRAPGATQADMFKSHSHKILTNVLADQSSAGSYMANNGSIPVYSWNGTPLYPPPSSYEGGTETRPKNVAVLFCQKN